MINDIYFFFNSVEDFIQSCIHAIDCVFNQRLPRRF